MCFIDLCIFLSYTLFIHETLFNYLAHVVFDLLCVQGGAPASQVVRTPAHSHPGLTLYPSSS